MDTDSLIAEYKAAYLAANGKPIHMIRYDGGWFRVRDVPHGYVNKFRRKQIEAFTVALKQRAQTAA